MTKIVIGLAAVVVLILVVVLLALRYLRADDGEDIDDVPDARGRVRGDADDRDRHAVGRRPARGSRPSRQAGDAEPRRAGERGSQRTERDFDRAGRYDAAERRGPRSTAKYSDRRGGEDASKRHDNLPPVRPRPARGKRSEDDGDWPSTKWDELSDVDYWAEVASDKPLTTTAQPARAASARPAQARPARPEQTRGPEARQGHGGRADPMPERMPAQRLPVRGERQSAAAATPAAVSLPAEFVPAPYAAPRAQPPRPMASPRTEPGIAMPGRRDGTLPRPQQQPATVLDDDPLTSPSFPKIPAADSRSYHGGRADTPASGFRTAQYGAPTQQFATYGSPSGQFDSYGTGPQSAALPTGFEPTGFDQPGRPAADPLSAPSYQPAPSPAPASYGGHTQPAGLPASQGSYQAEHLPPGGGAPPAPAQRLPSGNPYGSYVDSPAVDSPAVSYPASIPVSPPDSRLPAGYGGHAPGPGNGRQAGPIPQSVPGQASPAPGGPVSGWYQQPAAPAPAWSAASYPDVTRQLPAAGVPVGGYLTGSGPAEPQGYPGGQPEPVGYLPSGYPAQPHDPAGYAGPDPYGRDPYGGYPR